MNKIHVLDCTLRDGGYCNEWNFGFENSKKIINSLVDADIDIIECGFLTNKVTYNKDITKFTTVDELKTVIPKNKQNKLFVAMVNYGDYNIDDLPQYDGSSIDGIRVAFHKKNLSEALDLCNKIKAKGYKVFVQAMVSLSYTDNEFLNLINSINDIEPYAFYIVDSFGMMKSKNLIRLFYMVENNLKEGIWIGFHSHNNMQLAYSNAQSLTETKTNRNLIIDSSLYGMGRGAGNLNTELFVEFLNEHNNSNYILKPLLSIIDEILNGFYQKNYWGYSLPNYISAKHWAHPDYASYLTDKNTLTVENIDEIFSMMSQEKKVEFDKNYIENLYIQYMSTGKVQEEHLDELKKLVINKKVLLIAPGKSSITQKDKIINKAKSDDVIVISLNYDYTEIETDYIFISNLRRFKELDCNKYKKCIITSNIPADRIYIQTDYFKLINSQEFVRDNAGLMAIKFLISLGVKTIYLAGFDGYSYDNDENYASNEMEIITKKALIESINIGMCKEIKEMRKQANIEFLTSELYIH